MTNKILRIDASARTTASISRKLTDATVAVLGGTVIAHDLAANPPGFLTEDLIGAYFTPPGERSPAQTALLAASDAAVAEIRAADTIVIGMPVYNFGVPAALKAWADLVARVGETFRYTQAGPEGLLTGKRAIIVAASGGTQTGSEIDFATPWLTHFLGFIGIKDVRVVAADQLMMGADDKLAAAESAIAVLAA